MARFGPTGRAVVGKTRTPMDPTPKPTVQPPQPETDTRVNPSTEQAAREVLVALRNGSMTIDQIKALDPAVRAAVLQLIADEEKAAQAEKANADTAQAEMDALRGGANPVAPAPAAAGTPDNGDDVLKKALKAAQNPGVLVGQSATNAAAAPQPWVLRGTPQVKSPGRALTIAERNQMAGGRNQGRIYGAPKANLGDYYSEYAKKLLDPEFRDWITRRTAVLYHAKPEDIDLLSTGFATWKAGGDMVSSNPALKRTYTPEQWLDLQYALAGGDQAYDQLDAKDNPVTTTVNTHTYTVTSAQAQAMVDDLSRVLLGRLASPSEQKAARHAVNKLLTPTVTTTVQDATDPANVTQTTHTKQGNTPDDAKSILEMRMRRGSEGMAFNVGKMFEEALTRMR